MSTTASPNMATTSSARAPSESDSSSSNVGARRTASCGRTIAVAMAFTSGRADAAL
jgi:hypothetical protein